MSSRCRVTRRRRPARPRDGDYHSVAEQFMRPTTWIIGGALLLAGLGTGGYVYLNGDQNPPVRYKTAKIDRGTVTQAVTATDTITRVITVQVGRQVAS